MGEFVAVIDPLVLVVGKSISTDALKRLALLFDRFAMELNDEWIDRESDEVPPEVKADIRWLKDRGLLFEPRLDTHHKNWGEQLVKEFDSGVDNIFGLLETILDLEIRALKNAPSSKKKNRLIKRKLAKLEKTPIEEITKRLQSERFVQSLFRLFSSFARVQALHLREMRNIDAYPVISDLLSMGTAPTARRNESDTNNDKRITGS